MLTGSTNNSFLVINASAGIVILDKASVTNTLNAVAGISDIVTGATVQLSSTGTGGDQIYGGAGTNNTASGLVNMSGGTFDLNGKSESFSRLTGTGTVTSSLAGAVTLSLGDTGAGTGTFSGVIQNGSGTVALTKTGTGTLTLSGANTFTGNTTISNGKIALGIDTGLQNSPYNTTGSTGAIGLAVTGFTTPTLGGLVGSVNLATAITGYSSVTGLTLNPQTGSTPSYSGVIANGAAGMTLTKTGAGTQTLSGSNTYTGTTIINAGTLQLSGGTNRLPTTTTVNLANVAGATLDTNGQTQTLAGLTGGGPTGGNVVLGAGALTVNNSAANTFAGVISGVSGSLTKNGAGTLTLTGANSYSGPTTISGGTLTLGDGGTTGTISTSVYITNNANFTINRSNVVTQGVDFSGAAIDGTGNFIQAGSGTTTLSAANTYSGSTTVTSGTLNLTGNRTTNMNGIAVSGSGTLGISSGNFGMSSVNPFTVGSSTNGTVNQTGGFLTISGASDLVVVGTGGATGNYNLSGGTLTIFGNFSNTRGVILGSSSNSSGVFNLTGTGSLYITNGDLFGQLGMLQIGRHDGGGVTGTTGTFNQTGGTASAFVLSMGGGLASNSGTTAQLNLSGGTFQANSFSALSQGDNSSSIINISGTANVTLPAFPTSRGTGSTAEINFDGGTLRNYTASAAYMGGLTNAFIKAGRDDQHRQWQHQHQPSAADAWCFHRWRTNQEWCQHLGSQRRQHLLRPNHDWRRDLERQFDCGLG